MAESTNTYRRKDYEKITNSYALGFYTIRRLWSILKLIFCRRTCLAFLCLIGLISLLEQYIVYYVGIIPSGYYRVLGEADWNGFWKHTFKSLSLVFAIAFVLSSKQYVINVFYVSCREILTLNLQVLYFYRNKFYYMNTIDYQSTDNPDQRITQDIDKFCNQLSTTVSPLIVAPFTISYYTYFCYSATGWIGPVTIFGIFVLSAIINKLLIKPVMNSVILQEKCEGFFRFKHMNVRTYAESIAFQDARSAELYRCEKHLHNLITTQQTLFLRQFPLDSSVKLFNYFGSILSYFILAAPLFRGEYSNLSPPEIGALISKNAFVSIYLMSCFSSLVDLSNSISQIAGLTYRVSDLLELFEGNNSSCHKIHENKNDDVKEDPLEDSDDTVFELKHVTFGAPCEKTILVSDLTLKLNLNNNLLITGKSSSGKTSLLRVIKGLWPVTNGIIERRLPFEPSFLFFLPQKTLLTDGTLLEQIAYPLEVPKHFHSHQEKIDLILSYLNYVDLQHILDKAGLDDDVKWNWYDVLSPGEAQRLSFVRLFYHKPKLAFLDEATSAIGFEMEHKLYEKCKHLGITVVSIGHRTSLSQYHDTNLHLGGLGSWTLNTISH